MPVHTKGIQGGRDTIEMVQPIVVGFKHYTTHSAAFIFFAASIVAFLGIPSAGGQFWDDSIWIRSLFFLSWFLGTVSLSLFLWFRREITSNTLFTLGSGLATGVSLSLFFAPIISFFSQTI